MKIDIEQSVKSHAREELNKYSKLEEKKETSLEKLSTLESWVEPGTALGRYLYMNNKELLLRGHWQRFIPIFMPPKLVLRSDGVYVGTLVMISPMDDEFVYRKVEKDTLEKFIETKTFNVSLGIFSGMEDMQVGRAFPWVVDSISSLSLPKTAGRLKNKIS